MMRRLILISFLSLFTLQLNAQNEHQIQINSLLDICHKRDIFNGNALVIKKDKIIYRAEKGFVDGNKTKLLTKNSLFDIGSISKEFNAVGIMMLKEKGLLQLGDKLSKFGLDLPEWSNKITIKNLLQYTSGLPSIDWKNTHSDSDIYNSLKNLKALEFEPGTAYSYSNNNIFLQRRIIEKVTGKTFNQFLEQDIFKPLKIKNSIIDHQYNNPLFVRAFNSNGVNDEKMELKMSGSVCPTIDDLATWVHHLLSNQLISKESLHTLFESFSKQSQSALGEGKFTDNELNSYIHHGSSLNYESIVFSDLKEQTTIILMTNNKSLKIYEIAEAISQITKNETYTIPQKSVYLTIREKAYKNVDDGIAYYKKLKQSDFDTYNFSNQWELARLSYKLFEKNKNIQAIKILKLLVSELPNKSEETLEYLGARILSENQIYKSISVYQLLTEKFPSEKSYNGLGEAYYNNKQYDLAMENYKKSLELNPENENSKAMIEKIKTK
ncbi:hypothetical protein MTsPCn5_07700 [Croceitalea sp. MTPC5]|uniref:serine hydrolase n=1 Tax=Croceitalea sp. MTPC5 TaxID=3056565 RepID=UPI002B3745C5|nr:hypothetical protein MTsPCn5_07700 [Croceitalea sp. MTPC5]